MKLQFSVLMSIYDREKPEYVEQCFQSLLEQTVQADEWVVVEDGPLTPELYHLLARYQQEHPGLLKRIPFTENRGLGPALRDGITHCSFELIARMDTDDIARGDRFEKQLAMFEADPDLDICGSQILEFEGSVENIVSRRMVPLIHDEICRYQRKRDAFNHMTVMYKKQTVLNAGNYQTCPLMEDTLLWVNMIQSGARCANIDDDLVFVRIGYDMFERRGGFRYYRNYKNGRKRVYKTGFISAWDYYCTLAVQFAAALVPNQLRAFFYTTFLRRHIIS